MDDLSLAKAALSGDRAALDAFDQRLVAAARQALRPMGFSAADIDDVTQHTREALLVARDGAQPRLSTFSGRGPLDAWLRAVLARQALARRAHAAPETLGSDLPQRGPGAESRLRDAQHAAAVRAALAQAFSALTPRERTVLRLHGLDGLSLASIGAMYGKDASTISRWLQAARDAVRGDVAKALGQRLGLDSQSVEAVLQTAGVRADESLERLLQTSAAAS